MKEVQLIRIDSGKALINNMQDHYQISHCAPLDSARFIKNSDMEYVQHSQIEVENIPIQRIHDHGHEHYIAVPLKVWEYLYLLENPVTAKSQGKRIESLKSDNEHLSVKRNQAEYQIKYLNGEIDKIEKASLLNRIKWIFTGVRLWES